MLHPLRLIPLLLILLSVTGLVDAAQGMTPFGRTQLVIKPRVGDPVAMQVELANTPAQRARGLMYRTRLAPDSGMLFDLGQVQTVGMWMKNTYISLDMVFIRRDGVIDTIIEGAQPRSLRVLYSAGPVLGVLELPAGRVRQLGLRVGDRILHPIFDR